MRKNLLFIYMVALCFPAICQSLIDSSHWHYAKEPGNMTSDSTYHAKINPTQSIQVAYPENDTSLVTFEIGNSERVNYILISISRGEFATIAPKTSKVRFRFDDGQPESYQFYLPDDGRTNILAEDYDTANIIINKIKKARKLTVDFMLYKDGGNILTYDISGLKWDHVGIKKRPQKAKKQ